MCEHGKKIKSLTQQSRDPSLDAEFETWKTTFNKSYSTPDEEAFRRGLWEKNKQFVESHNQEYEKGLHTYTVGMNQFSDMEPHEVCCCGSRKGNKCS